MLSVMWSSSAPDHAQTGRYLYLNYSGSTPGAFPEAARVIGEVLADSWSSMQRPLSPAI